MKIQVQIGDLLWQLKPIEAVTWTDAMNAAAALGPGWRLPSVSELVAMFDYKKAAPLYFDGTGWFWTGDRVAGDKHNVWAVDMVYGNVSFHAAGSEYKARAVREITLEEWEKIV